jgi:hypothetical protein
MSIDSLLFPIGIGICAHSLCRKGFVKTVTMESKKSGRPSEYCCDDHKALAITIQNRKRKQKQRRIERERAFYEH